MKYKVLIGRKAIKDIQTAVEWYDQQKSGLGKMFHRALDSNIEVLRDNPFFQIRYDNVRCLPLKQFPYMIHFTIDTSNSVVVIRAVFNTSVDPAKWGEREP